MLTKIRSNAGMIGFISQTSHRFKPPTHSSLFSSIRNPHTITTFTPRTSLSSSLRVVLCPSAVLQPLLSNASACVQRSLSELSYGRDSCGEQVEPAMRVETRSDVGDSSGETRNWLASGRRRARQRGAAIGSFPLPALPRATPRLALLPTLNSDLLDYTAPLQNSPYSDIVSWSKNGISWPVIHVVTDPSGATMKRDMGQNNLTWSATV